MKRKLTNTKRIKAILHKVSKNEVYEPDTRTDWNRPTEYFFETSVVRTYDKRYADVRPYLRYCEKNTYFGYEKIKRKGKRNKNEVLPLGRTKNKVKLPTFSGWALFHGLPARRLRDWCEKYEEMAEAREVIRQTGRDWLIEGGLANEYPPKLVEFLLENEFRDESVDKEPTSPTSLLFLVHERAKVLEQHDLEHGIVDAEYDPIIDTDSFPRLIEELPKNEETTEKQGDEKSVDVSEILKTIHSTLEDRI